MSRQRRFRSSSRLGWGVVALVPVIAGVGGSGRAAASAVRPRLAVIQDLSYGQPDLLEPCDDGGSSPEADVVERTPQVAVNPVDPSNAVVVWEQGNRNEATDELGVQGAEDVMTATTTFDGGDTWQQRVVPNLDCRSGGPTPARGPVAEPDVAWGSDGTLYLATTSDARDPLDDQLVTPAPGIQVSASHDGGHTWSERPAQIDAGDRPALATDPVTGATAYVAYQHPVGDVGNSVLFRTTNDAGRSWSSPTVILPPSPLGAQALAQDVGVLADGTIVVVVLEATPFVTARVLAVTSHDHGRSWSLPVQIAECDPDFPFDHERGETGAPAIAGWNSPSLAIAGNAAYVTWSNLAPDLSNQTNPRPDFGQVLVASSSDGTTWSTPVVVNPGPSQAHQVFEPRVAVTPEGTIGIAYYDLRYDRQRPADTVLTAEFWLTASYDHGAHWTEIHVAGPFDLRAVGPGAFSNYIGLAAGRRGFEAAYALGSPIGTPAPAIEGAVDVFRARVLA